MGFVLVKKVTFLVEGVVAPPTHISHTMLCDRPTVALASAQGSQFHTVPAGTAGIYRSGQCTGTDNPLISYQKKYRPYQLHTGEIQLFQSVNGYRAETSFVRKENREEGEKEEDDDEARVAP